MSATPTNGDQRARLQDAIRSIRRLQQRVHELEHAAREPIAIVGMGCRFPGEVAGPDDYWRLLEDGVDAISEVPADRWDGPAYYDPDPDVPGKMYTLAGGFIGDVDRFDAELFGLSPREVAKIDPQHRLILEVAWEALEHAGVPPKGLAESSTGVYLGITAFEYGVHLSHVGPENIDAYSMTGTKLNFASGRLSYVLGLQGPSLSIDTACSSSLVAVHLACQALRRGECEMALAGGVNEMLSPEQTVAECKARMLSPEGLCKTFDADADGFVRGEGCGVMVLERLSTARAKNHPVIAVIRGSAINQDGPTSGPTVPNRIAQEGVIRAALADAGLSADEIDYVEAHGTATPLGDPIEVRALANVFGGGESRHAPLKIGSVKTNFGHLESAAGIAGLMKAVLGLEREAIPPHLHMTSPTPAVDWSSIPIEVVTRRVAWPSGDRVRRAGVSSFGASGTNAHVIVEEWRQDPAVATRGERSTHIYCLSAATGAGLAALVDRHAEALTDVSEEQLPDACHTVAVGRSHLRHRVAVVGENVAAIRQGLEAFQDSGSSPDVFAGTRSQPPRIAYLLSGRAGDIGAAGRTLYATQAAFRARIDECAEYLANRMERPLKDVLFEEYPARPIPSSHAEPALVAMHYALAAVWQSWGVAPAAIYGQGSGEYAAACLAGILSLEEALALAHSRGTILDAIREPGSMIAVAASADRVAAEIGERADVSIAAVNGPQSVVISGNTVQVAELTRGLEGQGMLTHALDTPHGLQSALLDPLLDDFVAAAGEIEARAPRRRMISSVSGAAVAAADKLDASYWRRQLREPVQFAAAMNTLSGDNIDAFIEIGYGSSLTQMARRSVQRRGATWACSLMPGQGDWQSMNQALAKLYAGGAPIDWSNVDDGYAQQMLRLPSYAFDRKRHWIDMPPAASETPRAAGDPTGHPLLGSRLRSPLATAQYEAALAVDRLPWLGDHEVFGHVVVPATAFVETLVAAARQTAQGDVQLEDVFIHAPIVVDGGRDVVVQTLVEPDSAGARARILSRGSGAADDSWTQHVSATLRAQDRSAHGNAESIDIDTVSARCGDAVDIDTLYTDMRDTGVRFGPAFRNVRRVRRGHNESIGWVSARAAPSHGADDPYWLHPALLDACLQVAREALPQSIRDQRDAAYVPMRVGRLSVIGQPGTELVVHARLVGDADSYELDLSIVDEDGRRMAEIDALRLARIERQDVDLAAGPREQGDVYELSWKPLPIAASQSASSESARWLVFDYGDPSLAGCAEALRSVGADVLRVTRGDTANLSSEDRQIRVDSPEEFRELIDGTVGAGGNWMIVHGGGRLADDDAIDVDALDDVQSVHLQSLLHLAQAIESSAARPERMFIVTCGAQDDVAAPALAGATAWGFGRVMQTEFPRLDTRLLDVDDGALTAQRLLAEAAADGAENQILYRDGERRVARLVPSAAAVASSRRNVAQRLVLGTPGIPDSLALGPMQRRSPGSGEVEIEVAAAGLNFRDVLVALGVYQGPAGPLGGECAGRVVAVGDGVDGFAPGDEVVAFTAGSMATHAVADARLTWTKPAALGFEAAATLPITFLTATYCLDHLGRMASGDRVLIHGAAGGVGMAAIQLARRAGAEIFATAGTPEKRRLVEELGADHALDSRSLDFAERIAELTDGEGVDLVLNSLAGEFIPASLEATATNGRFVEIGRTDIWSEQEVADVRPDVDYHTVLLGDVSEQDPELIQRLGAEIMADVDVGHLAPLPVSTWPMERAADAFRLMARAGHTGKLVLLNPMYADSADEAVGPVLGDGAYLITGAYGGLGLTVAEWLVDQGARCLLLLGRHDPDSQAMSVIDALRERGATVLPIVADVSSEAEVRGALKLLEEHDMTLRGVVHAAGTLDDGVLAEQDWKRLETVLDAKVSGAWILHVVTKNAPLDFFVLFSSASALFGAAGQGGYAAGNAFMDALARWRRSEGLPALSINWGPWADAGMFVDAGEAGRRAVTDRGFSLLSSDRNLATLGSLLDTGIASAGVFAADWGRFARSQPGGAAPMLIADLLGDAAQSADPADASDAFLRELRSTPGSRRRRLLVKQLRSEVAAVLNSSAADIRADQGFRELGMDSLMSVELRNRLERLLACSLMSTLAFDHPSVEQLADFLLAEVVAGDDRPDEPARSAVESTDDIDESVAELSDEEAERMLMEELTRMREADTHG